jgi:hypothetical protein
MGTWTGSIHFWAADKVLISTNALWLELGRDTARPRGLGTLFLTIPLTPHR